jgi:hypothetical protein
VFVVIRDESIAALSNDKKGNPDTIKRIRENTRRHKYLVSRMLNTIRHKYYTG